MNIVELKNIAADFVDRHIVANMPAGMNKYIVIGASVLYFELKFEKEVSEYCDMLGLLDDKGNINIPALKKALSECAKKGGELSIPPRRPVLDLEPKDIEAFIAMLPEK